MISFFRYLSILLLMHGLKSVLSDPWTYKCDETVNRCKRVNSQSVENGESLSVCQIFCGIDPGTLWPRVNGNISLSRPMISISASKIQFNFAGNTNEDTEFWQINKQRFHDQISKKIPFATDLIDTETELIIYIDVKSDDINLNFNTNEEYKINTITEGEETVKVSIEAETIFGARHAIETVSQLIAFDNIRNELQIVGNFKVNDKPAFPHRGLLLDTVRNFFPMDSIKRTIDAMAMVKLNVFHWHIADSQSFPMVLKSHPELSELGAYSADKVYTIADIQEIYSYAYSRGVFLLPEFDGPAHVGEGWQEKNVTACFNMEPWVDYCSEPPCGQFDPTKSNLYDILENIYREMYNAFGRPDRFHMGGDEVTEECWKTSQNILDWIKNRDLNVTTNAFMELWGYFQTNAVERIDRIANENTKIILWTSTLTGKNYVEKYLDKEKYVIQIWTLKSDPQITDLLERGYKLILSNYDNFYLDCGFGNWAGAGNNWCGPYKGWDRIYENNFTYFDKKYHSQFLGGEAAMWSEQVDHLTLDGRVWPRLSALAERLWTNPITSWTKAEKRMQIHRERLVENGIAAERLAPHWCLEHEDICVLPQKNAPENDKNDKEESNVVPSETSNGENNSNCVDFNYLFLVGVVFTTFFITL